MNKSIGSVLRLRGKTAAWLLCALACLLFAAMFYSRGEHVSNHENVLQRFSLPEGVQQPLYLSTPLTVGDEGFLDFSGSMARFIVVPSGTHAHEALLRLRRGEGDFYGDGNSLGGEAGENASTTLYVLFSYKTTSLEPLLFRYRSLAQLLTAVWVSDEAGDSFELIDLAGPDAPLYKESLAQPPESLAIFPSATLPKSPAQPRQVLVRIDSIFPYWANFSLSSIAAHAQHRSERNYLDGIVLGALLVSTTLALYGIYFRQSTDYLVFLLAASSLCLWYLALGEHFRAGDWVFLRRLVLVGPVYIYFLLHGIGLHLFLYKHDRTSQIKLPIWRQVPLWLFLGFVTCGLASSIAYAVLGIHTPFGSKINTINELLFVIAPALLLLTVVSAPDRRVPAYWLLVLVEVVGAFGSILQFVHFNTVLLDNRLADVLIQYPLPIEALLWAAALSARFNYLEMLAKRKVKAALRKEAKKARAAMQTTLESREQALVALDSSYRALDQIRASMLAIVDAHSHAAGNLLMRLGGHLGRMERGDIAEMPKHISAASKVLDDLATAVEKAEQAVEDAQSSQHALAPATSLLRWQLDVIKERLRERNVSVELAIDSNCEASFVHGYHFMEAVREVLSNINRYACSDSVAKIRLSRSSSYITLCAENSAVLREDDQSLREGNRVSPSNSMFISEKSSGRGLAALGILLNSIGGAVNYDTKEPSQVVITVVLPLN